MACRYTYQGKTYEAFEFDDVLRAMPPIEASKYMPSVKAIPSAPMIGKTDAWVGLALKRMLRYAVDNSYDKVAFINGQQAADLYDLSKQVDTLSVEANQDGTYDIKVEPIDGSTQTFRNKTAQEVEDTIGKDMASKAIASADAWQQANNEYREALKKEGATESELDTLRAKRDAIETEYSGEGLSVGGSGMRAFYDQIVPQVANDVLKKVGGGKVERGFGDAMPKDLNAELNKVKVAQGKVKDALAGIDQANWNYYSDMQSVNELLKKVSDAKEGIFTNKSLGNLQENDRISKLNDAERQIKEQLVPAVNELIEVSQAYRDKLATPSEYLDTANLAITITPEMRDKIMGGLPLFKRDTTLDAIANIGELRNKLVDKIQADVNAVTKGWKGAPDVVVVYDMNDERIPEGVRIENERQLSQGATGQPEGFYVGDKAYIVASEVRSRDDVMRVLFHEVLGHAGLRGVFNKTLDKELRLITIGRKSDVIKKARGYGQVGVDENGNPIVDVKTATDAEVWAAMTEKNKMVSAEEVLAELAQTKPELNLVQRAIAAIRTWLRENVPYFKDMALSDAEVIRNFILPARNFVENGGKAKMAKGVVFNRGNLVDDVLSAAYKNKGITRVDGKYLVAKTNKDNRGIFFVDGNINREVYSAIIAEAKENGLDTKKIYAFARQADYTGSSITVMRIDDFVNTAMSRTLPDTITVDGIERPTLNSNGKPIHPTREGIENFWRWFSDSKVVDEAGRPLVVYHGTGADFDVFDTNKTGKVTKAKSAEGTFWFTDSPVVAGSYANYAKKRMSTKGNKNLMPIYLKLDYPKIKDMAGKEYRELAIDFGGMVQTARKGLKSGTDWVVEPSDGLILKNFSDTPTGDRVIATHFAVFNKNQIKSAIGNTGSFNPNNDSILFSRQSRLQPEWESLSDSTLLDDLVYKFQDKHKDLKDVTKAIKNTGAHIADRFNTYLQEELYHGRVAKRTQDFITTELEPLLKALGDSGIPMADFEHYLWARHAEERNAQIAKVNPDMPDGGSGLTNAEAKAYLSGIDAQTKAKMEKMAGMVDAINKRSRNLLVEYGIEDMDTAMKMENAYQHYVPLMRDEMEKGFGGGTGQGFSIKGNSTKRAMGSNKAVVDILANIAQQREKFIVRGEKNRVATALVGLAVTNPNDEFWKVDKPPVIRFINKTTGLVDEMTDPNYKSRDNVVVARILDKNGRVQERAVVFNEFDKRASRMAESLKNLDVDGMEEWVSRIGSITRYFASVNTQYNPLFGVVNITRDIQSALLNLSSTALANDKADVISNTPSALKGIYSVLRGKRKGKEVHNRWADLWDEFQREGGQTGYRELFRTAKDRTDELQKVVDPTWWRNTKWGKALSLNSESLANAEQFAASKVGKPLFQWLEDYNTTLENSVRLSAYKVALDKGMTKQQAASLAKNLTVNFNRKGASGARMGAFYAFFNASVQGTARMGETMFKDGKLSMIGKRIIAGGMMLGVIQALALAGFDDDDPPQFERDRNLIIPIGDKKYIKIPMPLGFHVIPSSARILTEYAMNGGKDTPELIAHLGSLFAESFNPVGGSGSIRQIISPTVTDPLVALGENQDFAGRPIYQKDFNSLDPTPGFKRAKDTATKVSTFLAEIINKATGGTDYQPGIVSPTPDEIDYLVGQAFGGVGRESMKIENLATSMAEGTDLPTYKIPLLGKFYGNSKQQASEGAAFYRNIETMNRHGNEIQGRMKDGLEVKGYLAENPEAVLWRQANFSYRVVSKLRDKRQRLLDGGAPADDIKKVDEQITAQMRRFNELVSAKENPPS